MAKGIHGIPALWIGKYTIQRDTFPRLLHDSHMLSGKFSGMNQATGMRQHINFMIHPIGIAADPFGLVCHDQALLPLAFVRGDTGGAGILVTLQ